MPDELTGLLSGSDGRYVLIDDDNLPRLLDGTVKFARFRGGFVTVRGFAYGEYRFTLIAIANAT